MDDQQRIEDEVPGTSTQRTPLVLRTPKQRKDRIAAGLILPQPDDQDDIAYSPGSPEEEGPFKRDRHFKSRNIVSLTANNFDEYIASKEKALVLFYDVRKRKNPFLEQEFSDAADTVVNFKYGFGAVDCFYDGWLCGQLKTMMKTPMFKLYSNGFEVSSVIHTQEFNANQIHMLMKMSPILHKPRVEIGKDIQMEAEMKCTPPKKYICLSCI